MIRVPRPPSSSRTGRVRIGTFPALVFALGCVAMAVGAYWAWPRADARSRAPGLEIVLVDVSASACAPAGPEWSEWTRARLVEASRAAAARGDDVLVVAFGRDVRATSAAESGARARTRFEDAAFDATRAFAENGARAGAEASALAAALERAALAAAERPRAHVTLLGDGTFTGRDPASVAARLASARVAIDVQPPPVERGNVALGELVSPRAMEVGAPWVIEVPVRVTTGRRVPAPGDVQVEITRHDFDARDAAEPRTVRVPLDVGRIAREGGRTRVHVDLGPARAGLSTVRARVVIEDGTSTVDAVPQDDVASAWMRCAGSLVVGVVDARRDALALSSVLAAARVDATLSGVDVVALAPDELAGALPSLDALITVDAPLSPDDERLVASFVARGGGWIDVPGWNQIAARSRGDGALASTAALSPARARRAPREVVFLVDASGSMAGEPIEEVRAGLARLVDAVLPDDDVVVRTFAETVHAPLRLDARARREDPAARAAFTAEWARVGEPRGPTRLWQALETIAREAELDARERLVLLLTDGQDPDRADAASRARALRDRLRAARVRLVAATPHEGADAAFLESLAERAFPLAGRGADGEPLWTAVFRRELARDLVSSSPNQRVLPNAGASGLARGLARATDVLAPIDVAVRCDLAPGAEAFWVSAGDADAGVVGGEPRGAIARRGRGLVVSLAFSPATQWAPGWTDARALAPAVRLVAREHVDAPRSPVARLDGDLVIVEGLAPEAPAPLRARWRDASGNEGELELASNAPGLDPRTTRAARVPDGFDATAGWARWSLVGLDGTRDVVEIPFTAAGAGEFAFEPRRFAPPRVDGRDGPSATGAQPDAPRRRDPRSVPALWIGVACLFLGGLASVASRPRPE